MDLKWQDGAIPGKKLKKSSRTPEEASLAKKQYEQKRLLSFIFSKFYFYFSVRLLVTTFVSSNKVVYST
jgi:hypothetical protein